LTAKWDFPIVEKVIQLHWATELDELCGHLGQQCAAALIRGIAEAPFEIENIKWLDSDLFSQVVAFSNP
jgi:hypothetical protein